MTFHIVFVLLLGVSLTRATTEKIQLEDIERDNLISEQRTKAVNEGLEAQQTQHLRPPGIQPPNSFHQVIGGVTYATGPPDHQATIEFVTLPPQYPVPQPQMPQVHEEDRTHSAPSRQSLLGPQQTHQVNAQSRPQHTFAPQPQYVYIQAVPQQAQKAVSQPQFQTASQEVEAPGQSHAQQTQQLQFISLPQRDVQTRAHPGQASYVSVPYNYGGMYASPSAPSFTYQSAQGQAYVLPTHQPHFHHSVISGPTPTPGIQYAAATHSTASPIAYVKSPHSYVSATQVPFASYQHSFPQSIELPPPVAASSTKLLPVSHNNDFHPTLDFHGQSSNYHSLLDSYIPSSYIYARSKAAFSNNYPVRGSFSNFAPSFHYRPSHGYDAHGASSLYNTIAYSHEGGHHLSPSFTAKRAAIPGA